LTQVTNSDVLDGEEIEGMPKTYPFGL